MPIGLQAAQLVHGAIEWVLLYPELTKDWHNISNYVTILAVENESKLLDLIDKARNKNIRFSVFKEPDQDNAITCIVLEPGIYSKKLCSNIQLMGKLKPS